MLKVVNHSPAPKNNSNPFPGIIGLLFLALNLSPNASQLWPVLQISVYFPEAHGKEFASTLLFINLPQALFLPDLFSCTEKMLWSESIIPS
jgi:hypothetical protein